jgi:hypothetical protein
MSDPPRHLSAVEVEELLRIIEQSKSIVIGGQALALWCRFFLDRAPQIANFYSLSSEDLDVYGSTSEAKSLAHLLSEAELHIPPLWDNSPNAAVVTGKIGIHPVRIDFMRSVLGVEDHALRRNYVTLSKETDNGTLSINLMHPLDCLRSRLSNINDLHREGLHAISSARAALMIVDLFIDQALRIGNVREAQAMLMTLYYVARDRCLTKPADDKFSLNPIHIIQKYRLDVRLDHRFRSNQLASSIKRLLQKHQQKQSRKS